MSSSRAELLIGFLFILACDDTHPDVTETADGLSDHPTAVLDGDHTDVPGSVDDADADCNETGHGDITDVSGGNITDVSDTGGRNDFGVDTLLEDAGDIGACDTTHPSDPDFDNNDHVLEDTEWDAVDVDTVDTSYLTDGDPEPRPDAPHDTRSDVMDAD